MKKQQHYRDTDRTRVLLSTLHAIRISVVGKSEQCTRGASGAKELPRPDQEKPCMETKYHLPQPSQRRKRRVEGLC